MPNRLIAAAVTTILLALGGPPARAVTIDSVQVADTYSVDGRVLHLNGAGLRRKALLGIGVDVYVAALYLAEESHDSAAILASTMPKVVVIHFVHSGTKAQVEDSFRSGEENNCGHGGCDPAELPDFERLVAASPAVAVGDSSTYIHSPGRLRVYANTQLIGDFRDAALSNQLLEGWIGEHPPTTRLKRQMLGLEP